MEMSIFTERQVRPTLHGADILLTASFRNLLRFEQDANLSQDVQTIDPN